MTDMKESPEKKAIWQIKQDEQEKLAILFGEMGIFFAFGDSQFDKKRKEGVNYFRTESGLCVPQDKWDEFNKRFEEITQETRKIYDEYSTMDAFIEDELNNHEAYYTGDLEDAFEAVQLVYPECTAEDILRVVHKKRKKLI